VTIIAFGNLLVICSIPIQAACFVKKKCDDFGDLMQ